MFIVTDHDAQDIERVLALVEEREEVLVKSATSPQSPIVHIPRQ